MDEQKNILDPQTDVVHARMLIGDGEFTFCDVSTEFLDGEVGSFVGVATDRAVNCRACRERWLEVKRAVAGVRWSRSLKSVGGSDA